MGAVGVFHETRKPFAEAVGAMCSIRCLNAEIGRNGQQASVKESVIPLHIPGRPCLTGKDLLCYLVTYGPQPTLSS